MRRGLLLVVCFVVAACGSSGEKRLSKEDYAKQADAICTRYNHEAPSGLGAGKVTTKKVADLADRTLPVLGRTIAQLRRLRPPKDEQELADRWLSALDRLRRDAVEIRDAARANDLGGVAAAVAPSQRDMRTFYSLGTQLGMTVCNKPS